MGETARYLRLLGVLRPDRRVDLRPGYLDSRVRTQGVDPESPLRALVFDDEGRRLADFGLPLLRMCAPGVAILERCIDAWVPLHAAARRIELRYEGDLVHEIEVPRAGPELELRWSAKGEVRGKQSISWSARHPDGAPLEYFLRFAADGGTWMRATGRLQEPQAMLDFDRLPGGSACRLAVVATDGVNTTVVESASFQVARKGCIAVILEPESGARVEVGTEVRLRGQGYWLEERTIELRDLRWLSSRDGELGTGALCACRPSAGRHRIELTAGRGPGAGRAQIELLVGPER